MGEGTIWLCMTLHGLSNYREQSLERCFSISYRSSNSGEWPPLPDWFSNSDDLFDLLELPTLLPKLSTKRRKSFHEGDSRSASTLNALRLLYDDRTLELDHLASWYSRASSGELSFLKLLTKVLAVDQSVTPTCTQMFQRSSNLKRYYLQMTVSAKDWCDGSTRCRPLSWKATLD